MQHIKHLIKNGDNSLKNGAAKAAKKESRKVPPRVLNQADYEGKAGGHKDFGRFKADMATVTDQRKGLQKPLFKDDDGVLFYHQSNGKTPSQFRSRDDKQAEVYDRDQKGVQQSKEGVTGKSFLKDAPQRADRESHHIAPVKSLAFLFDGLDRKESTSLINYFEKRGVYIGNDPRNRADLTNATHTSVHQSYAKEAILKYSNASLDGMNLQDRMVFADQMVKEIKQARKMFKEGEMYYDIKEVTDGFNAAYKPGMVVEEPLKGSK